MPQSRIIAFRLNPGDAEDNEVLKWLKRQSRRSSMTKVIKRALREAMIEPEDPSEKVAEVVREVLAEREGPNEMMAEALMRLVDKLEATTGMSREEIAESAGVTVDFMSRMAQIRKQARAGSLEG